jgi:hypothetical protein
MDPKTMLATAALLSMPACYHGGGGGLPFADGGGAAADGGADDPAEADEGGGEANGDDGDGGGTGGSDDDPAQHVDEAKESFPTYLDLHQKVITRTCTPNQGVCHNQKEYPDLHTPETMLAMLGSPCNLAEADPLNLFDGCEPAGDVLRFTTGANLAFTAEVAFVELVEDPGGAITSADVHLRAAVPGAMSNPMVAESIAFDRDTDAGMLTVGAIESAASWVAGAKIVTIADWAALSDDAKSLLEVDVEGGDPNRNGEFGASEDPYRLILPGDPWKSYLLQRLQGNVPGSPMPLANQPLSSAEVLAIACWIEGAGATGDDPYAEIDYDGCDYAGEFGQGGDADGVGFAEDVQPIFDTRCAFGGCHGATVPAAELDLTEGESRENLLRASVQNPEVDLVTPGNPTNSYLVTKLTGNGVAGERMPKGTDPLSDAELEVIRKWISYGAADD